MPLNPEDQNKTSKELTLEANRGASEERVKEILSELVVRTVREWKNPEWFIEWVTTHDKKYSEKFLQNTLDNLIELELFEYCNDVELLKGQLQVFHSMNASA
jgi:hypothetical protein